MKVYGHPLSSCTRKVVMTAAEKATSIEVIAVDVLGGEHKRPAFLARHPFGVIPVLDDDGFVLFESRAIIRYLDARLPGASLVPASPQGRARMDQWLSVDQSYVAPPMQALVAQRIVRKHQGEPVDPAAVHDAERRLGDALAAIDRALAGDRYLAGEVFSLADISLAPYIAALAMVDAAHLRSELRQLDRWWDAVSSRASWQRAIAA
jgi:glutathione S-transferase